MCIQFNKISFLFSFTVESMQVVTFSCTGHNYRSMTYKLVPGSITHLYTTSIGGLQLFYSSCISRKKCSVRTTLIDTLRNSTGNTTSYNKGSNDILSCITGKCLNLSNLNVRMSACAPCLCK